MSEKVVRTRFSALDDISKVFRTIESNLAKSIGRIGKKTDDVSGKMKKSFGSMAASFGGNLAANAVSRGMSEIGRVISATTDQYIQFDDILSSAALKFPNAIKPGTKAFAELSDKVREMAASSRFSFTDAASGMNELAAIGLDASQSLAAFPKVMDLANAASVDLGQATEIATNTMGMFSMIVPDSEQLAKNMTRVNDVLAMTANISSSDVPGIFESLKEAGGYARLAGLDIEMLSATMAVMANAGLKGGQGGTQIKNMLKNMASITPRAQKALQKLGISFKDVNTGNFKDLPTIIDDLNRATQGMASVKKTDLIVKIFGGLSTAGVTALMNAGGEGLRGFNAQLKNATGYSEELSTSMQQTLQSRLKLLNNSFTDLGIRILQAFSGDVGASIETIAEKIRAFDVKPIVDGIKSFVGGVRDIYTWVNRLAPIMVPLISGFIAFKLALAVMTFKAFIVGITSAIGPTWSLNAAMAANPVGMVVLGFTAFAAVLATLIYFSDEVGSAFATLGASVINGLLIPVLLTIKAMKALSSTTLGKKMGLDFGAWDQREKELEALMEATQFGGSDTAGKNGRMPSQNARPRLGKVEAPNQSFADQAQYRQGTFTGSLVIANAPEGSKLTQQSNMPNFRASLAGAQ